MEQKIIKLTLLNNSK